MFVIVHWSILRTAALKSFSADSTISVSPGLASSDCLFLDSAGDLPGSCMMSVVVVVVVFIETWTFPSYATRHWILLNLPFKLAPSSQQVLRGGGWGRYFLFPERWRQAEVQTHHAASPGIMKSEGPLPPGGVESSSFYKSLMVGTGMLQFFLSVWMEYNSYCLKGRSY